ncbi:hypothetical protein WN51_01423 [Melipona quadrifasciata]|uniref:Uncharacterized protein n=1 Tax=Melipona quadrifasciata TaxID=166423 RepID=A0A0M8ZW44_9HYME|nr:hypothetical protein WN51_01423 [Melipona quadrifasciata]
MQSFATQLTQSNTRNHSWQSFKVSNRILFPISRKPVPTNQHKNSFTFTWYIERHDAIQLDAWCDRSVPDNATPTRGLRHAPSGITTLWDATEEDEISINLGVDPGVILRNDDGAKRRLHPFAREELRGRSTLPRWSALRDVSAFVQRGYLRHRSSAHVWQVVNAAVSCVITSSVNYPICQLCCNFKCRIPNPVNTKPKIKKSEMSNDCRHATILSLIKLKAGNDEWNSCIDYANIANEYGNWGNRIRRDKITSRHV